MNTTITQDNRSLQHDNKQLNALIKEYEQTLETLMSEHASRYFITFSEIRYQFQLHFGIVLLVSPLLKYLSFSDLPFSKTFKNASCL